MSDVVKDATHQFIFTDVEQELVANYFGKDIKKMEFYEVCELLDELINKTV